MKNKPGHFIAFCLYIFSPISQADELRVAVAANFYTTINLVKQRFEKEHDDAITLIRGSTGKLFAQIKHGAPYDVFLAADVKRPQRLENEKLIINGSRTTYAIGKLALWSNQAPENIIDQLQQNKFSKLAIANPKTAPYGQAAIEVLQQLGLYEKVKLKLVYGENIAQAFQFVQSGSADMGFVALSHVKSHKNYWLPPAASHHSLEQQLVILSQTKKPVLAKRFVNFMLREDIKKLIREQGYETL